jgi:hypothetical protein
MGQKEYLDDDYVLQFASLIPKRKEKISIFVNPNTTHVHGSC